MSFDYLKFTSLFQSDIAINGVMWFGEFFSNFYKQEVQGQKKYLWDFLKVNLVSLEQICRRCPRQRFPTGYWKP